MFKRALLALGSVAVGVIIVNGCQSSAAEAGITIVDAEVREWTSPDDGKVYIVVAPTWRNDGAEPVREVLIWVGLEGPNGDLRSTWDKDDEAAFVHYRGDPVYPGTTFRPSDAEDTFAVLGPKEDVIADLGQSPKAVAHVWSASEQLSEPEESRKQDPP